MRSLRPLGSRSGANRITSGADAGGTGRSDGVSYEPRTAFSPISLPKSCDWRRSRRMNSRSALCIVLLSGCLARERAPLTVNGLSSAARTGPAWIPRPAIPSRSPHPARRLESRRSLRAVVSGRGGRARLPDRQRRRPALTICLDAATGRELWRQGDHAGARAARSFTPTIRRRPLPRPTKTAWSCSLPTSDWPPTRPTGRIAGRSRSARSRASTEWPASPSSPGIWWCCSAISGAAPS